MITLVPTGVKAQMANDEVLMLFNRSSNPVKKGLVLINGVGVIDKDYYNNEQNEGEISFAFANTTDKDVVIEMNEKLGQGVFVKYFTTNDDKVETKRKGGFGSTGK